MSTQRVRVWVAGLTIGGAVNKAQNSTVSAFLYAVSGTSDLLVVPSQYFYFRTELFCVPSAFASCFLALFGDSCRAAANSSQSRHPTLLRKSLSVIPSFFQNGSGEVFFRSCCGVYFNPNPILLALPAFQLLKKMPVQKVIVFIGADGRSIPGFYT